MKVDRKYCHKGALGDIIYSLPTIISFGGGCLHLRKKDQYKFIHTLLEKQFYVRGVKFGHGFEEYPLPISLDSYRKVARKNPHFNLPLIYLQIFNKQYDLSKPWLQNISPKFINKIILNRTNKYHNEEDSLNYNLLKKYKDIITFIGLERDHNVFEKKYNIKVDFYKVKDALEMAQIIKGSKIFVGNQSLCFALAESMKHPRVLEVCKKWDNCRPNSSNGYVQLTDDIVNYHLNNNFILPTIIAQEDIKKSVVLESIFEKSKKTTVFLPNYGEFGSTVHKLIRIVDFHNSPKKIVCCKRGEEVYFPSADEFYYDWNDCVQDIHKWGFFVKRKKVKDKNDKIINYGKMLQEDFIKIKSKFGENVNYVHLWKFNSDKEYEKHASNFRVKLKPKEIRGIRADIIISPRNRTSRSENNFLQWEELIDFFNTNGYSVGCVGSKEHSLKLRNSFVNSWDYKDNASAVIELLNNCKLYLGLDTGVSHLASIISVPMIIFSHSRQKSYFAWMMEQATLNYFLDLGNNVQDIDIIKTSCLKYLECN